MSMALLVFCLLNRIARNADDFSDTQLDLTRIQGIIYQIHAFEEEAVVAKILSPERARAEEQVDEQADTALRDLRRNHPHSALLEQVQTAYLAYDAALDTEFPHLSRGDVEGAEKVADARVDPAYAHLQQTIDKAVAEYNIQADEKRKQTGLTAALVLLSGGLCLGVVMRRVVQAQRAAILQQSEAQYRQVVEHVKDVIFTADAGGNWTFLNPAWTEITGYSSSESIGKNFADFVCEENRAQTLTVFEAMRQNHKNYDCYETRCKCEWGEIRWIEARVQSTLDAAGALTGFFGTLCNITERKAADERLEHQALHDALTGLPNRLLFQDRIGGALKRMARAQTGVAVLFVDLDNFKIVNDSMGHEAGDTLLQTVAQRLEASARNGDTIARLGGDEFTLLLENVRSVEEAAQTAERIVAQLQQPVTLGGREVFVSASIGIAFSSDDGLEAEDLLRDADTAMYQAKTQGKSGFVVFNASMNADVVERMEIETGLRFALERDELRVHYQPLINLETGRMTGVEALARWQHPTRGLMAPGLFIPIAEETGLILPIGYWVLEEACRQMQVWKAEHPDYGVFTVNVNLSGKQLQRPDVVERVSAILEKTRIAPESVKLEITESVMMADVEDTVAKLRRLKALGVKLAMDDFGTGYSSMASLNLFPLDTVKIDRAFIKRLAEHHESESIVAAIIMLSKALHLDVTGEGVETVEQATQLQGLGCQIGQGYFFARPLPADGIRDGIAAGPQHFAQSIQQSGKTVLPAKTVEQYLLAA